MPQTSNGKLVVNYRYHSCDLMYVYHVQTCHFIGLSPCHSFSLNALSRTPPCIFMSSYPSLWHSISPQYIYTSISISMSFHAHPAIPFVKHCIWYYAISSSFPPSHLMSLPMSYRETLHHIYVPHVILCHSLLSHGHPFPKCTPAIQPHVHRLIINTAFDVITCSSTPSLNIYVHQFETSSSILCT